MLLKHHLTIKEAEEIALFNSDGNGERNNGEEENEYESKMNLYDDDNEDGYGEMAEEEDGEGGGGDLE